MSAFVSTPAARVQQTESTSPFILGCKARAERVQRCRDMAKEMSLPGLAGFPSEYEMEKVEKAYAAFQAEYNAYLEERAAEIAARDSDHAEEMGRIEQFA